MIKIKSLALSELSSEEFVQKLKELLSNKEGGGVFDLIWGPELEFEVITKQNEEPAKNNLDNDL